MYHALIDGITQNIDFLIARCPWAEDRLTLDTHKEFLFSVEGPFEDGLAAMDFFRY